MRLIITGADGALGRAVVRLHAEAGDRAAELHGSAGAIDDAANGKFAAGDLAVEEAARASIGRAAEWLGTVDALVHLVGGFRWIEAGAATLADWRAMFDANVATAVASVGAVLPSLVDGGSIVLVGANSAQPAGSGFGPYGAAKSGVARLAEALSAELKPRRIRVNAVLPAIIDTPQNRADMPSADPSSWTRPEAVAEVIGFLASNRSRAINGALVPVANAA